MLNAKKQSTKIAILGFGMENQSVLKFIKPQYKDAEIWILDKNENLKVPKGIKSQLGKNYLKDLRRFDLIFRTPGIPYLLVKGKSGKAKISSLIQLFFDNKKGLVIGVTGTKGKGTTSTLIYQILKNAGKKVFLVGNIGKPALDIVPDLTPNSITILELSSFQLQDIKSSPEIVGILDIFPDHLDSHKDFNEYINAKSQIARFQKPENKIFFLNENKWSKWIASKSKAKKIPVSVKAFKKFSQDDLKIPGFHNFKNVAMATTICESLGIKKKIIEKTVLGFTGTEHRLELIRTIGKIRIYNDSASTNPQTAAAAVNAFPNQNRILIAGGKDKNLDYKPLAQALKSSKTNLVVLVGENKNKIFNQISKLYHNIIFAQNFKQAIEIGYAEAKKESKLNNGITNLILSPASASFDTFKNYKDRGEQFKGLVLRLK